MSHITSVEQLLMVLWLQGSTLPGKSSVVTGKAIWRQVGAAGCGVATESMSLLDLGRHVTHFMLLCGSEAVAEPCYENIKC